MSEESQQPQEQPPTDIECSMCGKDGGPEPSCDLCKGNQRFVQRKQFTMTEERQGKNPNAGNRYGRYGEVGPKVEQTDVVMPRQR